MSSSSVTRIHSRGGGGDAPAPKQQGFSVLETTLRTTLFPPRGPQEPAGTPANPNESAKTPVNPAPAHDEPRPRFAAGGTQILNRPSASQIATGAMHTAPFADAQTQHFAVEQLLSRRAELKRELEQELNRELEQELALLTNESDAALRAHDEQSSLEAAPAPAKRRKVWLRLGMVGLFLASVAMLLYKPAQETAPPARATSLPSAPAPERAAPARIASAPLPEIAPSSGRTLQRAAADIIAEGRYAEALGLYRKLAESEPENPAYAEIVRILEHRVAPELASPPR